VFGLFQTVTVSRDIKGLVLKIGKDAIVTGRVVVESDGAKASPMRSLTLRSHDLPDMNFGIQQSIELGADGRFQNREVEPGVYAIAQSEGPWYVSSIVQDGKTSADGHIELKAEGKTNLDVTYRKASSMLQVDVLRDAGMTADQPVQLRLFPADPALRFQAGGFRLAAFVKSEQSTFTLGPVPPGSYLLLATYSDPNVQRLEAFRWNLMKNRAIPVVLHEGATETIQVKPLALETGQ
jgi:hypothetical protein